MALPTTSAASRSNTVPVVPSQNVRDPIGSLQRIELDQTIHASLPPFLGGSGEGGSEVVNAHANLLPKSPDIEPSSNKPRLMRNCGLSIRLRT